jgi:hypothetical protein
MRITKGDPCKLAIDAEFLRDGTITIEVAGEIVAWCRNVKATKEWLTELRGLIDETIAELEKTK